jgi:hypothetical protein
LALRMADVVFLFVGFPDPAILMRLSAIFGATVYSIYSTRDRGPCQ